MNKPIETACTFCVKSNAACGNLLGCVPRLFQLLADCAGIVPERCLRELAEQGIQYNLVELTDNTHVMAGYFEREFANAAAARFTRMNLGNRPEQFFPIILASVRDSMRANRAFH